MPNIFDKARKLADQSPVPMTLYQALAELGRRGAVKKRAKKKVLQPPMVGWWNND
jgi:hypothetical protein